MIIGIEKYKGDAPTAKANDKDAKPTSARPCPINECFFKTNITPKIAAQSDTKIPAINARCIGAYDNI